MKKNIFAIFLIASIFTISCQNQHEVDNKIQLSKEEVTIWIGQKANIRILSAGSSTFTIKSENDQIARADIIGDVITITARENEGIVNLVLTNKFDEINKTIRVHVKTLSGAWKATGGNVKVDIDNNEGVKETIEEEVLTLISKIHSVGFDNTTHKLTVFTTDHLKYYGIYSFKNMLLEMSYMNRIEKYSVCFLGERNIQLKQDLTDLFAKKYPNTKVNKVEIDRLFTYISF